MKNKSKYIGPTLNLNINNDDDELNDFLYCWEQFESRPNKMLIHNTYSTKLFVELLNKYIIERNFFTEVSPDEEDFIINDKMFVKLSEDVYCSYVIIDRNHENSMVNELNFFYKSESDFEYIQKIVEKLNECTFNLEEDKSSKLNTVVISSKNVLDIEPIDISEFDTDNFQLYYSEKTGEDIKKIIKEIKKSKKGLSILHGERGTGKTSIINYLASKLDRTVIFIPNNMIENTINNSEFTKLLKIYSNPVIIIDDCEMLFHEYFTKSNMFVNNLLQMVDGFLSDSIGVNIISIFNIENEDEIDHHLLESNNLVGVVEFEFLNEEESNDLAKHLSSKKKYKNKNKLVDIIKNNNTGRDYKKIGLN